MGEEKKKDDKKADDKKADDKKVNDTKKSNDTKANDTKVVIEDDKKNGSRRLEEVEQVQAIPQEYGRSTTQYCEACYLLSWCAGLWYFLYYLVMQPLVERFANQNGGPNKNLGNFLFYSYNN